MTQSDNPEMADSTPNNSQTAQSGNVPIRKRFHKFIHGLFGRKPAYRITKHGIEVRYFNFSDTDTLPFDTETYKETQIFIGEWANPWYFDIDSIKEEYPNFTEEEITEITDVFSTDHVYPSQRWKLLANQNALRDMFVGGAFDEQKIMRLLYAACAGIGVIGLILIFGGP